MTTEELNQRLASLAEQMAATERIMAETITETDRQIAETNRQIGGLSTKFGSFTDEIAYRSCKRILREYFGMEQTALEIEVERADGQSEEYNLLGVANGDRNEVMMVEIKRLYLATGADENFELLPAPPGFRPRDF